MRKVEGLNINYWTIIKRVSPLKAICKCKCGNEKEVFIDNVLRGVSKSCGCYIPKRGTHNMSATHEYYIYNTMINRCYNKKTDGYRLYGAKGITVCDRWLESFENFISDMGLRPSSKHSIDRYPNAKGNYEPSNCRWATPKEQALNKSSTKTYLYKKQLCTISDLSKLLLIPQSSLRRYITKHGLKKTVKLYAN